MNVLLLFKEDDNYSMWLANQGPFNRPEHID